MKNRFSLKTLFFLTTCIAFLFAAFIWLAPGVTVTVHNSGDTTLHDLRVHVTGQTYGLGDASGGAIKKCTVRPRGDSHVEISYRLADGTLMRHSVDCYFESGDRGTVDAEIGDGRLISSSHQIRFLLLETEKGDGRKKGTGVVSVQLTCVTPGSPFTPPTSQRVANRAT